MLVNEQGFIRIYGSCRFSENAKIIIEYFSLGYKSTEVLPFMLMKHCTMNKIYYEWNVLVASV